MHAPTEPKLYKPGTLNARWSTKRWRMADDVVLIKAASIERCVARALEEYEADPPTIPHIFLLHTNLFPSRGQAKKELPIKQPWLVQRVEKGLNPAPWPTKGVCMGVLIWRSGLFIAPDLLVPRIDHEVCSRRVKKQKNYQALDWSFLALAFLPSWPFVLQFQIDRV